MLTLWIKLLLHSYFFPENIVMMISHLLISFSYCAF